MRMGLIGLTIVVVSMGLLLCGCGSSSQTVKEQQEPVEQTAAGDEAATEETTAEQEVDSQGQQLIKGVEIRETPEAYEVFISANHTLDYTLAEPPFQQAKVLYFPDAALDMETTTYASSNDIIGTVEAIELVKGGPSKIVIPVSNPEADFEVRRPGETALNVVFPKTGGEGNGQEKDTAASEEEVDEAAQAQEESQSEAASSAVKRPEKSAPLANRLHAVEIQEHENRVDIKVVANGSVKVYKSFALPSPDRIVLDLDGIESDYDKEQRLKVDSSIVKQVRHFSHPDYLRLVVDVDPDYLSQYEVASIRDGLLISVGESEAVAEAMPEAAPASETATEEASEEATSEEVASGEEATEETYVVAAAPAATGTEEAAGAASASENETAAAAAEDEDVREYDRPALVNAIDFIEEREGRSTIKIGTTHPVNYDLEEKGERELRLTLENTNILSFRQRPLITTRFNSAVDLILPVQTEKMKAAEKTLVNIQLREGVPYEVERKNSSLLVHFAPSSVPPDPDKEVAIPTQQSLEAEEAEAEEEAEVAAEAEAEEEADTVQEEPSAEEMAAKEPSQDEIQDASAQEEEMSVADEAAARETAESDAAPAEVAATEESRDAEVADIFGDKKNKVYTGEPIALDFYKTDIRNVIRIIRDVSGKNFAIDKDVGGSVTLSFVNPVPWDQVLDLVLEMNDLGMIKQDGILRISTKDTIRRQKEAARAELAAEQELKKTEEQMAPLMTEYFAVSYSNASADIMPHLEDLLSERGHAKVDSRTNQVIMTDTMENIEKARNIIEKIDRVTPQVMIKARVVETSTNFSREFGTEWGMDNSPGVESSDLGGTYNYDVAMNNPAGTATNTLGVDFSRIVGTPFSLDAKLSLMETNGQVKIISSPRIVTLDNKKATISQGQEIPYTSATSDKIETEFKDADLKLEVTPHVTPDNRISMKIFIEEKEVGEVRFAGGEPPLNTKEAQTELLVNDGDTIVIGGIIQETERENEGGVPYLKDIPLLGHLFKNTSRTNEKSELLIFITPTVVRLD
ncbi:MAG: type IV pilus secretin PilQ [Desulfosudaceae bacterium]